MQTFNILPLFEAEPRGFKTEKDEQAHALAILIKVVQNKRNHSLISVSIERLYMLKTLYMHNKLLNGYKRCLSVKISPYIIFSQNDNLVFCTPVS